jgi:hypothetical protein
MIRSALVDAIKEKYERDFLEEIQKTKLNTW